MNEIHYDPALDETALLANFAPSSPINNPVDATEVLAARLQSASSVPYVDGKDWDIEEGTSRSRGGHESKEEKKVRQKELNRLAAERSRQKRRRDT